MSPLDQELEYRASQGLHPVTVKEMDSRLRAIGYRMDRGEDCFSNNRYMTGPRAGHSYPAINTGVSEVDTGKSAFHLEARRDSSFRALQDIRGECSLFAVTRGRILEI